MIILLKTKLFVWETFSGLFFSVILSTVKFMMEVFLLFSLLLANFMHYPFYFRVKECRWIQARLILEGCFMQLVFVSF